MKHLKNISAVILVLTISLNSCKKDPAPQQVLNMGYNYIPDEIGSYVIYEVDSIAYDDKSHEPDTTRYQLMEMIAAAFIDNSGRPALRIERFVKMHNDSIPYDSLNWVGPKVWHANKTSKTYEKVEENVRFVKLIFPSKKSQEWDGNVYNTFNTRYYETMSIDEPETFGSNSFDSVITIKQYEQIDLIQYVFLSEKYARNVGLIYKVRDSLYHGSTLDTIGYTYRQKIVSYGK